MLFIKIFVDRRDAKCPTNVIMGNNIAAEHLLASIDIGLTTFSELLTANNSSPEAEHQITQINFPSFTQFAFNYFVFPGRITSWEQEHSYFIETLQQGLR